MVRRSIPAAAVGFLVVCLVLFTLGKAVLAQQKAEREDSKAQAAPAAHDVAGSARAEHEAGGAGAEHGSSADSNPLAIKPELTFWTLIVFLGLMFILGKYAWKPLMDALHRREQHLEHVLLETERARNDSEALLAEHRRLMAKSAEDVRNILDKGRHEAQAAADQIVKEAQTEAEAARDRAHRDIAAARDQALAEIWEKTANVAVSVAGRVLEKQLSGDDHRRLLDHAIQALPEVAERNGHGGPAA
jgi:F-type H+-transporting ATPase subunit b